MIKPSCGAAKPGSWAILTGDSVHCFGDGILIASAFVADIRLGAIAALAVLVHEVPHHMGDLMVMRSGASNKKIALIKDISMGVARLVRFHEKLFLKSSLGNKNVEVIEIEK